MALIRVELFVVGDPSGTRGDFKDEVIATSGSSVRVGVPGCIRIIGSKGGCASAAMGGDWGWIPDRFMGAVEVIVTYRWCTGTRETSCRGCSFRRKGGGIQRGRSPSRLMIELILCIFCLYMYQEGCEGMLIIM